MAAYEEYWIRRAEQRIAERHRYLDASILQINHAYQAAMKELNREINRLLLQFARENGLTRAEAEALLQEKLSARELDNLRQKLDTVTDEEIRTKLMQELEATYYKGRISRQEALREAIRLQMAALASQEIEISTAAYTNVIRDEYYHNMFDIQKGLGFAFSFAELPERVIEQILQDNWSGKHYSRRIWGNTQVMARQIEEIILKGAMLGTNSRKMARELNEIAHTGMYACERLIRTETTYFTAMADLEAAKARGTARVQFVATLDARTSPQCRAADGEIIPVEEAQPGKNIPPLHPFCRSVIIDVIKGLVHKVRRARNPITGKNILVPASMTYQEWAKLSLTEKNVAFGNVHNVTFQKMAGRSNLSNKQIERIREAIAKLSEEYDIRLDYFEVGNYTEYEGVPLFYKAIEENGHYKSKLIINNACSFWTNAHIRKRLLAHPDFQGRTIEDLINHEMAHVMTFQGCKSMEDYLRLEAEVHPLYSSGVSKYALQSEDGAEAIAEAFVKQRQKRAVNLRSQYLLDKYVEVWRK